MSFVLLKGSASWSLCAIVGFCFSSCERPNPNYVHVLIDVPARDVQDGVVRYLRSSSGILEGDRASVAWLDHNKVEQESPEWAQRALWDALYVKTDGIYEIRTRRLDDLRLTSLQFTALGTDDLALRARRELDRCMLYNNWFVVGPPSTPSDGR